MTTQVRDRIDNTSTLPLRNTVALELEQNDGRGDTWLKLSGHWSRIVTMENLWELDGEWLNDQPVIRMRFLVTTEDNRRLTVFRDLVEGSWYREISLAD